MPISLPNLNTFLATAKLPPKLSIFLAILTLSSFKAVPSALSRMPVARNLIKYWTSLQS